MDINLSFHSDPNLVAKSADAMYEMLHVRYIPGSVEYYRGVDEVMDRYCYGIGMGMGEKIVIVYVKKVAYNCVLLTWVILFC